MSGTVERFDEKARRGFSRYGRTVLHRGQILRHPVYTRIIHWSVAISFVLALLSGFAVYSPWLFHWLTPLFGGGPMTRLLHPWFGLAFVVAFAFQFFNWLGPMTWTKVDSQWMKEVKGYATNKEALAPERTGFFNAGQKIYFWAIVVSAILLLITGVLMWFDHIVPRWFVAISYVLHDIAALVMLGGFIIHLYESTSAQPGTFQAMTNGTVSKEWAWTHHPAWYAKVTGRNPREDYERALEQRTQRQRAFESEREQVTREPHPRDQS